MPRKCRVGGFNSNYDTENEHLKVQRFPSDADEEQKWINTLVNILPKEPMQDMIVCIKRWPSVKKVTKFSLIHHPFFLYQLALRSKLEVHHE